MSAAIESSPPSTPRLRDIALAAVAGTCLRANETMPAAEDLLLQKAFQLVGSGGHSLAETFAAALREPAAADRRLVELGRELQLDRAELLTVALAVAVEEDLLTGRVLAHAQSPVGGSRPTLGLLCHAFETAFEM
jgi:hypothetical protein